nr:DUF5931 domain-containing protein [Nocardiopsis kunsanensis]
MGFDVPLWRTFALYRAVALVHAVVLVVQHHEHLTRPWTAGGVLAVMALWTLVSARLYARPHLRGRRVLTADLLVAFGCLFATALAAGPHYLTQAAPLSAYWFAGAVLATGAVAGVRAAVLVAFLYGLGDLALREFMGAAVTGATLRGVVLLLLAGTAVGYMAGVAHRAETRFARAVELEARMREREQIARSVHDSVLQVLALVHRRGEEAGGEAAELGRMAGEQEALLRALVSGTVAPAQDVPGTADLCELLRGQGSALVSVSGPADPVELPEHIARELAAAVRAALDNVAVHCPEGTRSWVLLEHEETGVTVSVRDEGPGIAEGRLEEARREGRLGFTQSLLGRVHDLGGTVEVVSGPGEGTEVEIRLPRPRSAGVRA